MANTSFKVGDFAYFSGYSDPNIAEDDKLLKVGQRVQIKSIDDQGAMAAIPVDEAGNDIADGDTVFEDEIKTPEEWLSYVSVLTDDTGDPDVADDIAAVLTPDKPKSKGKGKNAKSAPIELEPVASETKGKSKGKGKGKELVPVQDTLPVVGDELEVTHVSSVQALLAEKDALDAAKELVLRKEETEFTLGGVLAHIQREGIFHRLGFSGKRGFEEYIEKELKVRYRKAMYLIQIYEKFSRIPGIDVRRLAEIGWSKAKELVNIDINTDNFDDLIEIGKTKTRDEMVEHIRETYVNANASSDTVTTPKVKQTAINFKLFADQADTVKNALEAAKAQAGSDDPNAALEHICAEWALMSENVEMNVESAIAAIEGKFKIRLQIVSETEDGQTDIEDAIRQTDAAE